MTLFHKLMVQKLGKNNNNQIVSGEKDKGLEWGNWEWNAGPVISSCVIPITPPLWALVASFVKYMRVLALLGLCENKIKWNNLSCFPNLSDAKSQSAC